MSPDAYLQFAASFISFFLKTAIACLLCFLLARLLGSPRQRFMLWTSFMLSSLAYWIYTITASFSVSVSQLSARLAGAANSPSKFSAHFLVPAKFEPAVVMIGRPIIYGYIAAVLLLLSARVWKRIRLHFLLKDGTTPPA